MRATLMIASLAAVLGMAQVQAHAQAHTASSLVLVPDSDSPVWSQAPASLPKAMQISILAGNPDKPGPFTLRLKMPAGTTIAPHTHATPESVTVLSGAIVHDMGDTLVRSRGKTVATGGFVFLPADMPHSLWTNSQAAEIQVSGTGPFGLHYINPADDPSRAR